MTRTRVLIVGAAGRDFHNFNLVYRGREEYEVVAFTATQIPNIDGRVYPRELAGELYPDGIPFAPPGPKRGGSARSASRTSLREPSSSPGSTTRRSSTGPSRRPT